MILPYLIAAIVILGIIYLYIAVIGPRINPMNKAISYMNQNMVDEAILEYKKILDKNPANFVVHYKLAEIFFQNNDIDQGAIHLEKVLFINKFNYEIEKIEVLRRLGKIYLIRHDIEKAFEVYFEILKTHPVDDEALYHVSFISLGQEMFDVAQRSFLRLASQNKKNFEILFGAGIATYQNHRTEDAINYFKNALNIEPHSDIANLSMALALHRKKDFKTGINYCKMIIENSEDEDAVFIAKRLLGLQYVQGKKGQEGVKIFEELLGHAKSNSMTDEIPVLLYDLGFACLKAELTELAYEHFNELYQIERGFKDVQLLITLLRKEMDDSSKAAQMDNMHTIQASAENWFNDAFPQNFLWRICGLKGDMELDLRKYVVASKSGHTRSDMADTGDSAGYSASDEERIDRFCEQDVENFRIISNRIVAKLGYNVDEILQTYRENDGVDFLARSNERKDVKALIWVRRWKGVKIGEIPLRNFAQEINDMKVSHGLFITTSELTPAGEESASRLSKVTVIHPDKLAELLTNLL